MNMIVSNTGFQPRANYLFDPSTYRGKNLNYFFIQTTIRSTIRTKIDQFDNFEYIKKM